MNIKFSLLALSFLVLPFVTAAQTSKIPQQCVDSSGSGTAQTCTTVLPIAAKDVFVYTPGTTNTGALTLTINGGSALPVQKWLGTALASGDVVANKPLLASTDGTNVYIMTIGNAPSGGGGGGTVTTTGSPATGNLSEFSGATSITNGNLSGDVTTSNTLATTLAAIGGATFSPGAIAIGTVIGSTNGHFVCQSASTANLVVDSATICTAGFGIGIYIGATGTQTAPVVEMRPY